MSAQAANLRHALLGAETPCEQCTKFRAFTDGESGPCLDPEIRRVVDAIQTCNNVDPVEANTGSAS